MCSPASKASASTGNSTASAPLTEAQATEKIQAYIDKIDVATEKFLSRGNDKDLEELFPGIANGVRIERYKMKDMMFDIKTLNSDIDNGYGFQFYDPDQVIHILYRNGKTLRVDTDWDDTKKIPTSNIDSVIVESGWGIAVAGNKIRLYDNEAAVPIGVGKYNVYKNAVEKWEAIKSNGPDIRAEFK